MPNLTINQFPRITALAEDITGVLALLWTPAQEKTHVPLRD